MLCFCACILKPFFDPGMYGQDSFSKTKQTKKGSDGAQDLSEGENVQPYFLYGDKGKWADC
jgi:hypothetical protein